VVALCACSVLFFWFKVPLHELSKHTVFAPGETVAWAGGADDSVPRGTIGEVRASESAGGIMV